MVDVDGIVEKLETNEKIIKICSESLKLPHLIEHLNQISSTLTTNGSGACSSSSSSNSLNAHAPLPQPPTPLSSQILLNAVNANATSTTNSAQPMSSSSSSSSSSSCSLPNNQFNQPESNILRLFAKQLLTLKVCNKQTHSNIFNRYPSIKLWLKLLNISMSSIDAISSKKLNFHDLYERKDEQELNGYLRKNDVKLNDNELDILFKAFQILKIYYSNVEKDPSTNKNTSQTTTGANSSYQYIANASRQQLDQLTDNNNNNNNQSSSPNGSALVANKNITNHIIPTTSTSASISSSSSSSSSSVLTNEHTPAVSIGIQPATTTNNVRQNIEPNPNYLSSRSKQQRKSESDVQVDGVMNSKSNMLKNHLHHHHPNNGNYAAGNHHHLTSYYNINTNTNSPHLNKSHLSSTLNNINNSTATSANKNLTFSPNLAIKPSKKNNAQKVTTPPPSRKLSTGNPSAIVTTAQIKAIAAYAAKTIKDYEPTPTTTTGKANSKTNLDGGVNVAGGDAFNDETADSSNNSNGGSMNNIHRSSSHESHLRNKVYSQSSNSQLSPNAINDANFVGSYDQQHITTTGTGSNDHHNSYNSLNSNAKHQHQQSSTENMRRLSDGSELSSMCPSGQASPNLQSPTHAYKQTYGSNLTSGDDLNKLNQKSPKQTRDHSWTNTWNIKNCGICNKKMFMGLKCKYCKFRCHKECEKKSPQKCRVGLVLLTDGMSSNSSMIQSVSSSSASSSTAPSPAIMGAYHNGNGNGANTSGSLNPQQKSKSSSSCNSSEPNSPNAFSPFQTFLQSFSSPNNHPMNTDNNNNSLGYHLNNNNSHITNNAINANKKSSSSSISSASIGYYQQPNSMSQSQSLVIGTTVNDTPGDDEGGRKRDQSGVEFDLSNNASTTNKTFDPAIDSIQTSVNSLKASRLDKTLTDMTNATTTTTTTTSSSTTTTTSNTAVTDMNDFPAESDTSQMNSSSSNDVQQFNIVYDEITDKEELGRGRFGVVYKAHWHGFVAVKEIDFNVELGSGGDESIELKNFREEVLNLKKTRHTNLILFIGACMKPPKCAIVMSLCRGVSLYKYLRSDTYNRPNFDWIIDIATQIAQGMGYLHNKQLIHKDLRSKNIFIDGGKALITDFGLYSFTKLCTKLKRDDLIPITKECLFYMAPELVRLIGTNRIDKEFSQASDVYSFGTIWYELFCYEYPFSNHSTDTVLYLIGHGLKNYSPNIQIPKEFKFILMKCWSKEPSNRLDFSRLLETFRAIPKKSKLFRSPSHPVHIGRSLEALHTATLNDTNKN